MKNMEYALKENIGSPELFTGRRLLMDNFIHWVSLIGKELGKSRALLSRRKKGKTVLMQRLFNIVWSQNEKVVPFFYEMKEHNMTLGEFAEDFLCTFLSHYYAFKYRDKQYIIYSLKIEELVYFFEDDFIIRLINTFKSYKEEQNESVMWELARKAPHAVASYLDIRVLQFIDEFQNINKFILDKDKEPITTLAGSYLASAESKCAPMLIAGSYTGLLRQIIWEQLPARFNEIFLGNLEMAEGYDMILKYSQFYEMPVNTQTTQYILGLTQGDPYYISTLFESSYMGKKYLTNANSISDVYSYEITKGNINGTWSEYLRKGFSEETDLNDKRIALYLFNATGKERTREQIMTDLKFEMTDNELEKKLKALVYSDIISQGESNNRYKVSNDKIYELVFRNIYQEEIDKIGNDIHKSLKSQIGKFSFDMGHFYEYQFEKIFNKGFNLKDVTYNGDDRFIVAGAEVYRNYFFKETRLRNMEIDIYGKAEDETEVLIELKNQSRKTGKKETGKFIKLKKKFDEENRKAIFIHFSMNGYTNDAENELFENGIFFGDEIKFPVIAKKA